MLPLPPCQASTFTKDHDSTYLIPILLASCDALVKACERMDSRGTFSSVWTISNNEGQGIVGKGMSSLCPMVGTAWWGRQTDPQARLWDKGPHVGDNLHPPEPYSTAKETIGKTEKQPMVQNQLQALHLHLIKCFYFRYTENSTMQGSASLEFQELGDRCQPGLHIKFLASHGSRERSCLKNLLQLSPKPN